MGGGGDTLICGASYLWFTYCGLHCIPVDSTVECCGPSPVGTACKDGQARNETVTILAPPKDAGQSNSQTAELYLLPPVPCAAL